MGRGNVCVYREYEGLYYIDWEHYYERIEQDQAELVEPYSSYYYVLADDMYQQDEGGFVENFCDKFPSFVSTSDRKKWLPYPQHDCRILAESKLYYLVAQDNEWSVAIKLVRKDGTYGEDLSGIQMKHFDNYFEGLKNILLKYYDSLGTYAGAWTSGRIERNKEEE